MQNSPLISWHDCVWRNCNQWPLPLLMGLSGVLVAPLAQAGEVFSHRAADLLPESIAVATADPPVANVSPERDVVPESAAPESAAPESAAPESAAPESVVPGSAAPESAAPESAVPEPLLLADVEVLPRLAAAADALPQTQAQAPAPSASPSIADPGRTTTPITPPITTPQTGEAPTGDLPGQPERLPPLEKEEEKEKEEEEEDNDLGDLNVQPIDEDLGKVPARPLPSPPPKQAPAKWLYLSGRLDYFNSGNVFAASDRLQDALIRPGVTLSAFPKLGPNTYLLGAVDGNIVRYGKYGRSPDALNYDELRLRAGILQQLSPRMYGEIGWTNQKLYTAKDGLRNILSGDRFLNENALRVEFSRTDPLSQKLSWSNYYQFRWNTSNRSDNERLVHSLFTGLNYKLTPAWNAGLDYFISWSHYTNRDRDDVYQQIQWRTGYSVNRNLQVNVFGGYSFGGSTDDRRVFGRSPAAGQYPNSQLQYDAWFFGVNLVVSTPLL